MTISHKKKLVYHLIWLIGALASVLILGEFMHMMDAQSAKTYEFKYGFLSFITVGYACGIYLAFINGLPKRMELNITYLLLFVLSGLVFVYPYASFQFGWPLGPVAYYMDRYNYHVHIFVGIISGYCFVKSLFRFQGK